MVLLKSWQLARYIHDLKKNLNCQISHSLNQSNSCLLYFANPALLLLNPCPRLLFNERLLCSVLIGRWAGLAVGPGGRVPLHVHVPLPEGVAELLLGLHREGPAQHGQVAQGREAGQRGQQGGQPTVGGRGGRGPQAEVHNLQGAQAPGGEEGGPGFSSCLCLGRLAVVGEVQRPQRGEAAPLTHRSWGGGGDTHGMRGS